MTWIILRTAPRSTLKLAHALNEAGFEAWTPRETKAYRAPRASKAIERTFPMMPSFVFARAERMFDLFRLSKEKRKAQPDFSLFHHRDRVPVITEASLEPVRQVEDRAENLRQRALRAKARPPEFDRGQVVSVPGGAFAGMSGRVERQKGSDVIICFDRLCIEVDAWQVVPNGALSAPIAA